MFSPEILHPPESHLWNLLRHLRGTLGTHLLQEQICGTTNEREIELHKPQVKNNIVRGIFHLFFFVGRAGAGAGPAANKALTFESRILESSRMRVCDRWVNHKESTTRNQPQGITNANATYDRPR